MEVLSIEGSKFVKASKIAKDFGYTSDYIGQLCRAGKIKAKLVGRTWYVEESTLHSHKKNRYQKDQSIVKKNSFNNQSDSSSRFYEHANRVKVAAYDKDEAELMPSLKKVEKPTVSRIPVELAEAQSVNIKSQADSYDFETPIRPEIIFKGDLVVNAIPEIDFEDNEEEELKPDLKRPKIAQNKLRISEDYSEPLSRPRRTSINRMRHLETQATVTIKKAETEEVISKSSFSYWVVFTVLIGVLMATALIGFERNIQIDGQSQETTFSISLDELIANVYGSK